VEYCATNKNIGHVIMTVVINMGSTKATVPFPIGHQSKNQ